MLILHNTYPFADVGSANTGEVHSWFHWSPLESEVDWCVAGLYLEERERHASIIKAICVMQFTVLYGGFPTIANYVLW